ncbi:MAG: hypothetical protein J6R86_04565 [Lentisphaeria bacterium]|nr:hypothetical protein [Lentisphaeria bacterium]
MNDYKKLCENLVQRKIEKCYPRPDWWRVRVPEIIDDVNAVKKGHVEVAAHTPGGFPVYVVTYGEKLPQRKVNWPSLTGSKHPEYYTNTAQQTLMFIAGIHAEETEGITTLSNFIKLLETGVDHRGVPRPYLVDLAKNYRIVIMPCVNMDARSFAPDCLMGCMPEDYGPIQTRLKNGEYLVWPDLKEYFPLPMEEVDQLGTYYNFDGVNIQLDSAPGNIISEEAKAILKIAHEERIDCMVNLHSAQMSPHFVHPTIINYPGNYKTVHTLNRLWSDKIGRVLNYGEEAYSVQCDINDAVSMATGAVTMTFEAAALKVEPFENKLEVAYKMLETVMEYGMERRLSPRDTMMRRPVENQ